MRAKGALNGKGSGCPRLHEGDGDGVTEQHLDGGAGDGRQVEGAQLALRTQLPWNSATCTQSCRPEACGARALDC